MPINALHLLDQADALTQVLGRPRGADLRRAISAAYYAVFHVLLTAAADSVVPANRRATPEYARVYRSVTHNALRDLCRAVIVNNPPGTFRQDIQKLAGTILELREKRHSADYDPLFRVTKSDTLVLISGARAVITRFRTAVADEQQAFVSLLLFPARRS